MNIKMIATDLDDTLLRDDKTISDITKAALVKCRDRGIKVVYATARGQSAPALVPIDLIDGFTQMNGAVAFAGESLIYSKHISIASSRDFLLAADNAGIQIAVETGGRHYANFDVGEVWGWVTNYTVSDFAALDINAEKIYALPKSDSEIDLLKKHLPKNTYLIISRYDNFTMIMHEDAGKAKAVAALADHWNISIKDVVAFGDDTNDIGMLRHCGIGVAMGNAIDEVKSAADDICDTNENDGIAKWLEKHVL